MLVKFSAFFVVLSLMVTLAFGFDGPPSMDHGARIGDDDYSKPTDERHPSPPSTSN